MSDTTSFDTLVERLDAEVSDASQNSLSEHERTEYERLVRRGVMPHAALAVLGGRATDRAIRDAEPIADTVVRSILRMPPRADLPEADAIVWAVR